MSTHRNLLHLPHQLHADRKPTQPPARKPARAQPIAQKWALRLLRATEQLTLRQLSRGDSRMAGRRGHGDGGIDEPYPGHYRLRWRVDGRRYSKIFQGSLGEARRELRRLLKTADDGEHVAPDRQRVADYLRDWLGADTRISPKTRERYQQLAERQIIPHLGAALLQKVKPSQIDAWHSTLLKGGLPSR